MKAQLWLRQAARDLETAEYLFDGKRYKEASLFSQQAAEKALKAVLIHQQHRLIRIHDIVKLGELVRIDPGFRDSSKRLTTVYVDARYPDTGTSSYSRAESSKDIASARRILQWAESNI